MVDPKTLGVLTTLGASVAVMSILLLVFLILRPKLPQVYQFRRLLNRYAAYNDFNGSRVAFPSTRPSAGLFGWVGPALATPESEVLSRIGLDATMFLRFMRSQLMSFAICAAVCAAVLWPTYGTGPNKDLLETEDAAVSGLQILSLSNVALGDARLWATLSCEYIVCAVFLYFLYKDYSVYAGYRRTYRTAESPANYAIVVYDIPTGHNTDEKVRQRFELMVPGQVSEVVLARKAKAGIKAEKVLNKIIAKKERAEFLRATTDTEPMTRPGTCGALMCWKAKVPAVDYFNSERERLEAEIVEQGASAPNANAAIVVFTNKRAASLIAQANQGGNSNEWTVYRAGEPAAVHWPAFHIPGYQAVWRAIAVIAFVFFLTFFWIVPASLIVGLASVKSLTKTFSWLEFILDLPSFVVGLLENTLPALILTIFLALIPLFMRLAVSQTRVHSLHIIDSKTRNYFYAFTIFASFIFIVLGAAVLEHLQPMIDDPSLITRLLASGVPGAGLFYVSFVILKFVPLLVLLLSPGRVIVRWIKLKLSKTERERRAAEETSSIFVYFKMYGSAMMMTLIGLTYTTLAPLVTVTVLIWFTMAFAVFKHNVVFATHRQWDGAGNDYPGAFYSVIVSLIIKQLTMVGVMGLYEAPAQTVLAIVPLIATALFGIFCHRRFSRVALHGSLHDQYTRGAKMDEIPASYAGLYRHPGIAIQPYQNLSGMVDPNDVYPEESADGQTDLKGENQDPEAGYVQDGRGRI